MGQVRQTDEFGPVAGIDKNVIRLSPAYLLTKQNELGAAANMANQSKAIGELLVHLSAELATLNTTSDHPAKMESVALGFSRLGETFEAAGMALGRWDAKTTPNRL